MVAVTYPALRVAIRAYGGSVRIEDRLRNYLPSELPGPRYVARVYMHGSVYQGEGDTRATATEAALATLPGWTTRGAAQTQAPRAKPATKLTDTRADVLALIAQYKHIGEYVPRYKEGAHRGVGMYPVTIAEIAARWLMKHKLVERSQYGGLAITELGRKALLETVR